jgi:hypothetical protein
MKTVIAAFLIACVLMLPSVSQYIDTEMPLRGIITFPAIGIDYMCVFFHEIGHSIAWWLFGYPALPSFDFNDGGGMTYSFTRSWFLFGCIWLALFAGVAWMFKFCGGRAGAASLAAALLFFIPAFFPLHDSIAAFMGHGFEVMIACFCLVRGLLNRADNKVERVLNLVFGCYAIMRNLLLAAGLIASDVMREAYDMQKSHVSGDFRTIADMQDMRIESVAMMALIFIALMGISALATAYCLRGEIRN